MRRTLFISDLHLDETRRHVTQAFLEFLQREAVACDALYILGDLFEAWIGDDDHSELNKEIITALASLTGGGVPTYIMHGNRDFLIGKQFCRAAGCELLADPSVIDFYGQTTLLMHGDSLCTSDAEYMAFRAKIRDPATQQQLMSKPLAERRQIAAELRAGSASANSNKAEDIMDVTTSEVVQQMQHYHSRRLIHGHTHRPSRHTVALEDGVAQRIVLGDWGTKLWYVDLRPEQLDLVQQPIR
ncbi:MAG: UDP-2,3-diacylglucosamine diphosphatase [Pseudomonadales bacterium]